jgi:F420-dependent oxidoreductase-like protein
VRLGIHNIQFKAPEGPPGIAAQLTRVAEAAEEAGASWLSVMDHYFQMDQLFPAADPMLEGYTTLGYLAAKTETLTLGLLVTGVSYRHPGLLAKIVATLDVLSGGRGALGIGAAWYEREHRGLGVPFPPMAERFERLEETLRICLAMWDPATTEAIRGKHYQLAETLCSPAPLSSPHPLVLVGGQGERKTLRLVAQYADACNIFAMAHEQVGHKLDVLKGHCDAVGRDEAEIDKTILVAPDLFEDRAGLLDAMDGYAKLGVGTVIVRPPGERPDDWIRTYAAPAVPALAALG